jgi:hypothetical protein
MSEKFTIRIPADVSAALRQLGPLVSIPGLPEPSRNALVVMLLREALAARAPEKGEDE